MNIHRFTRTDESPVRPDADHSGKKQIRIPLLSPRKRSSSHLVRWAALAERGAGTPLSATQDADFAFFRTLRIDYVVCWVLAIPIAAPLVQIAVHVVESPGVRRKGAYGRGFVSIHTFLTLAVNCFSVVIRFIRGNRFAKGKRRCRTSTATILPFSLCWESIRLFVLFRQLLDEVLRFPPSIRRPSAGSFRPCEKKRPAHCPHF